ncbi:MAG TPA: amidohydrolase family protein [Acidimicrobiales bacterium]|jgi:N-acyl-D-aspartate/D-glutamate deacylase|nr:amidohydrolase family protein [Acidimicrobiales bacterium]
MLDHVISGGTIVDGTGQPARRADIGIKDGRIVALTEPGELDEPTARTIDATDLVVTPGFVDPHTHYDAQLYWDPLATPSTWHGVTSVIGGNCGFTLAPLRERDADYTRRMMAQVEGMPLVALEQGLPWKWETFGEYLEGLDGSLAVNAGFMVGHCALRRYVLGEDFGRVSTPEELGQIRQLLRESLAAGGLGLSTTRSTTHVDGDGEPVPSRHASEDEVLALCEVVAEFEGTSLEAIVQGCLSRFDDDEIELLARMSATARRPLNWNVLSVAADDAGKIDHQLQASTRAHELGGRVVALTMPIFADNNMSFLTFCALWLLPGWRDVLAVDVPEKIRRLKDPAVRADLMAKAEPSPLSRLADFGNYLIGDVFSALNEQYRNRRVGDIAAERGEDPFTTIVDIVANDELKTVLWPIPAADTDADWELRRKLWEHEDVLLGGSDAGAHLDRMLGSPYPTRFIADCLRGRQLVPLERAVHLMTDVPARLFGLRDRGRLAPRCFADVVLIDPSTVDATPARIAFDLPGESKRLLADPVGVVRVLVNGQETIVDGEPTGTLPGTVLRSGRDTEGTATSGAA